MSLLELVKGSNDKDLTPDAVMAYATGRTEEAIDLVTQCRNKRIRFTYFQRVSRWAFGEPDAALDKWLIDKGIPESIAAEELRVKLEKESEANVRREIESAKRTAKEKPDGVRQLNERNQSTQYAARPAVGRNKARNTGNPPAAPTSEYAQRQGALGGPSKENRRTA